MAIVFGESTLDDEGRFRLIERALADERLTDRVKLFAIGSIVESRKPLHPADIQRTRELAEKYGWK